MAIATGNNELTVNGILKEFYPTGACTNETYEGGPAWALVNKRRAMGQVTGRTFVESIVFASSQGHGSSGSPSLNGSTQPQSLSSGGWTSGFNYAQGRGQKTATQSVEFVVYRQTTYRDFSIATESLLSTEDDRGAFESVVTLETDNNLKYFGYNLETYMLGQNGMRGQIANSSMATSVLQLVNPSDAVKFEIGQELDLCSAISGGTIRSYGSGNHGLLVGSVDAIAGTLTIVTPAGAAVNISDGTDGVSGAAAGDFIFLRTDYGFTPYGFEDWIPYGGPSSSSFSGVDRTKQANRLAGAWMDNSLKSVEDGIIDAVTMQARLSSKPITHVIMPWGQYGQLQKSGTAKRVVVQETEYDVAFRGINIFTAQGEITALPCRNIRSDRMFFINIDTWDYVHLGKEPVNIFKLDGSTMLRQSSEDGVEGRMFAMGNLVCREPWANLTAKVQAL